jgi:hypothetical protein
MQKHRNASLVPAANAGGPPLVNLEVNNLLNLFETKNNAISREHG